jgi:hypothetical protein
VRPWSAGYRPPLLVAFGVLIVSGIIAASDTATPVYAATFTVNETDESLSDGVCDDICTLFDAITESQNSNGPTVDLVDLTGVSGTITLTQALPEITENLTIGGPGSDVLTIDANGSGDNPRRVFTITFEAQTDLSVQINGLRLVGGDIADDGDAFIDDSGGAIFVGSQIEVTFDDLLIENNRAREDTPSNGLGGGIYVDNASVLRMTNSTLRSNVADAAGGGIYLAENVEAALTNVTIGGVEAGNSALLGGGIFVAGQN